jgi:hypothetical protein
MAVIKMRGSDHSHELRTYEITPKGITVGPGLTEYDGIMTGVPALRPNAVPGKEPATVKAKPTEKPAKPAAAKRRK